MKVVDYIRTMRRSEFGRLMYSMCLAWYHKIVHPIRCMRLRQHGMRLLSLASECLEGSSLEYYIYWGTLLGAMREHDFIKADDDIDIIVNRNAPFGKIKSLVEQLLQHKFKFVHVVRTMDKNLYITFKYMGVHVDFFFYDEDIEHNQIIYQGVHEKSDVKYANEDQCSTRLLKMPWCKPGSVIDFKGMNLRIPARPFDALIRSYGPNWKKPIPGWKTPNDYYEYVDELAQRYTNLSDIIM